jgi:hypothetical protein
VRATPVAKGHHEIVFTYQPLSLCAGGGVSVLALLGLLLLASARRVPDAGLRPYATPS